MKMNPARIVFFACALTPIAALSNLFVASHAAQQAIGASPLQQARERLRANLSQAERNTRLFISQQRIGEGPCGEYYRGLPENSVIVPGSVPGDFFVFDDGVGPIPDLDAQRFGLERDVRDLTREKDNLTKQWNQLRQEIKNLRSDRRAEAQALAGIKAGQAEALRDWLLNHYAAKIVSLERISNQNQTEIVQNTLFGAITTRYPSELEAADPPHDGTNVTFTPSVFMQDLFPNGIRIGPARLNIGKIPKDQLDFTPTNVDAGRGSKNFQFGDKELIASLKSIRWDWRTDPGPNFKGKSFKILMEASRNVPKRGDVTVTAAQLPIDIGLSRNQGFFASLLSDIKSNFVGYFVVAFLGWFFPRIVGAWLKRSQKVQAA